MRISVSSLLAGIMTDKGGSRLNVSERIVRIHIEKLPECMYLATSDDVQGLIAQGRAIAETLEIARDVARKLIEAQSDVQPPHVEESFDYPLIVG
jgi:predicted RNase H-like HicB family nuclease